MRNSLLDHEDHERAGEIVALLKSPVSGLSEEHEDALLAELEGCYQRLFQFCMAMAPRPN